MNDISRNHLNLLLHFCFKYTRFHIKGTWSVHSFNGDYLSIPKGIGSRGYLFHKIPGIKKMWIEQSNSKQVRYNSVFESIIKKTKE